jgi:organic radical activating enzyme
MTPSIPSASLPPERRRDDAPPEPPSDRVVLIEHEKLEASDFFLVNWCLSNHCNFRCSYCNETLNSGSMHWPDASVVLSFAFRIIQQLRKRRKKVAFEFTGGEVTLYKDLSLVLEYLKNRGCHTSILSNASLRLSSWPNILKSLDRLIVSFHAEHCSPEHFSSVVELASKSARTHVNIMMNPHRFETCRTLGQSLTERFSDEITLTYQPLLKRLTNGADMVEYTDEQYASIRALNDELYRTRRAQPVTGRGLMKNHTAGGDCHLMGPDQYVTADLNRWKGWLCWAGVEQVVVSTSGQVFRGWCVQDPVGYVSDVGPLPTQPVVCRKDKCHCHFDMLTRKQRPLYLSKDDIHVLERMNRPSEAVAGTTTEPMAHEQISYQGSDASDGT